MRWVDHTVSCNVGVEEIKIEGKGRKEERSKEKHIGLSKQIKSKQEKGF
jgi:hypothetical protein